ncbi:MAG: hypothetical protein JST42_24225 [Bacteroidetes bacterium]|nr:hypothetical protein [Bacteroidota bacterium]
MIRLRTIRHLLAVVMLALFALGITPKIAVHALVARHTDRHLALASQRTDLLTRAGFFCRVDSLVVELPCFSFPVSFSLAPPRVFSTGRGVRAADQYYFLPPFIFGLRGPPSFDKYRA